MDGWMDVMAGLARAVTSSNDGMTSSKLLWSDFQAMSQGSQR